MEKKKDKRGKRVYSSMMEFKREFFPVSYREEPEEEKIKDAATYGTGLAMELLESIRQQLAK